MSMSLGIVGIKAPDAKWKRMKEVYDVCVKNNVAIPEEVDDFFEGDEPNEKGVVVDIDNCVKDIGREYCDGFILEIAKLPKDITHIEFTNS